MTPRGTRSGTVAALALVIAAATASGVGPSARSPAPAPTTPSGRVVLVSLDGMGTRLFLDDPVAEELGALRAVRARGVMAEGLQSHMPSTTANTHAALWTGTWGDVNGIVANEMPLPPDGSRRITDRVTGYGSEGLRAEPLWEAAARQGVRTVAQQASQVYPFRESLTRGRFPVPPVVVHGYQARVVAPARWLRLNAEHRAPCTDVEPGAQACYAWRGGPVSFRAARSRDARGRVTVAVRVDGQPGTVTAVAVPTEHDAPRGRALARHFSDGLLVDMPDVPPGVVYVRAFVESTDADPESIVVFQSVLQATALFPGRSASRADVLAYLREAGGFVGNGRGESWDAETVGGRPLWRGGDGTRERRYLETVELGMRQTIRQAEWLARTHAPRLLVGYVSMPDEMDHAWLGHAATDARYTALRRWGYQLVDRVVATYVGLTTAADHLVFVSDHGMRVVDREVRVNHALRDAGLVAVDASGRIDVARSSVVFDRNCLRVHTRDWSGGPVPADLRRATLDRAEAVLLGIREPADGLPIVTEVLRSDADRERFGFGGPNGFDACLDVRAGYYASTALGAGPAVRPRTRPTGEHGFLPTHPDMHGILIAAGPGMRAGSTWPVQRAVDVAPLVSRLLGIAPPAQSRGRVPPMP